MPQLKAAQEVLFTSNDDPPEREVKSTKFRPRSHYAGKFENATLLLRMRLPSTLIRLYPHKKIHVHGTF